MRGSAAGDKINDEILRPPVMVYLSTGNFSSLYVWYGRQVAKI
jgi:hypothetical protein